MKNTAIVAGQPCPLARLRARKHFAVALLLCAAVTTPSAYAGDPCKTVISCPSADRGFTQKINDKFGKN